MARPQLRLYLLAHAATRAQREFRFPSPDDPIEPPPRPRTVALSSLVEDCRRVWCGPEQRCIETAHALTLTPMPVDALRAWSAGAWAGQSLATIAEQDPTGFTAWRTDPSAAPLNGEQLKALLARVGTWLDRQAAAEAGRALVIADPAVIRAIVVYVLQAAPPTFWRFDIPPLSVSVVQHASDQWRLRQLAGC